MKKIIFILLMIYLSYIHSAFSIEVAITVDDLPGRSDLPAEVSNRDVARKMLYVFKKHHMTGIYGLINGYKLQENKDGFAILQAWMNAGHVLGNHTYHHLDLAKTDSHVYIKDIQKNESVLVQLMGTKDHHYFRYPYLSEGNTQEKRDTVRHYLFNQGYKIAPVTIDFFEYEWNDPYVRCVNKHDQNSIEWLKKTYIEQAINALIISHELSKMLFKRDIKNVLLIHLNSFTPEMLDDLLTEYEKRGVVFISLKEAISDPIYKINPNIILDRAYTFLNQVRLSRKLKNPEIVRRLYSTLPEDKLNKLCR